MNILRLLLATLLVAILGYTAIVIEHHGWDLMPVFFGDIAKMGWPGQFNLDFLGFLILSATWLMWRHQFSAAGLFWGLCGFLGGTPFLCIYLLIASLQAKGDMRTLLLGNSRAMDKAQ